ncbi:MAG TPA: tetratricopeptide repeat protein [Ktedonobacteraceae bacterium]|nr:tetratricopeptide repeat protein [Ktedonobacteraceae bacterium]
MRQLLWNTHEFSPAEPAMQHASPFVFGVSATIPPPTDLPTIMPRADEVNTILRMLNDAWTSAVMLIGTPGVGKSTLAALLYQRLLQAKQAALPAPSHLLWLTLDTYTTVADMVAAILNGLGVKDPGFFQMKSEQQLALLQQTLRNPQMSALVILDQFELLLHAETHPSVVEQGALALFLALLQTDLGNSRIVLTGYHNPYDQPDLEDVEMRMRSYLVSRISIPEGTALLQQLGVQGSPKELSLIWQRCGGHAFALVLFSSLMHLSGIALSYLLDAPDYQPMWAGEVTVHLISALYQFFNPMQHALMRALCFFHEPVPLQGMMMTMSGSSSSAEVEQYRYEQALQTLTQLSLVQTMTSAAGVVSYWLHPLLRQSLLEHYLEGKDQPVQQELAAAGESSSITPLPHGAEAWRATLAAGYLHVATYYLHLVRTVCPPREQRKGLQDIEPVIAAVRYLCLGWRWQSACDLLFEEGLHECMVQWEACHALIGLYLALLPPLGSLSQRDEGLVCRHMGLLYGRIGEYQLAQAYFERALALQRQSGDLPEEITTLTDLGELWRLQGEHQQARIHFEHALTLNQQRQDFPAHMRLLHRLGLIFHEEKNYAQALHCYETALRLMQTHNVQEVRCAGQILSDLGMVLYEQALYKEALAVLLAALQLLRTQKDSTALTLERFLSTLEQKMGTSAYAQLCQDALEIQQQVLARFVLANMRQ